MPETPKIEVRIIPLLSLPVDLQLLMALTPEIAADLERRQAESGLPMSDYLMTVLKSPALLEEQKRQLLHARDTRNRVQSALQAESDAHVRERLALRDQIHALSLRRDELEQQVEQLLDGELNDEGDWREKLKESEQALVVAAVAQDKAERACEALRARNRNQAVMIEGLEKRVALQAERDGAIEACGFLSSIGSKLGQLLIEARQQVVDITVDRDAGNRQLAAWDERYKELEQQLGHSQDELHEARREYYKRDELIDELIDELNVELHSTQDELRDREVRLEQERNKVDQQDEAGYQRGLLQGRHNARREAWTEFTGVLADQLEERFGDALQRIRNMEVPSPL